MLFFPCFWWAAVPFLPPALDFQWMSGLIPTILFSFLK